MWYTIHGNDDGKRGKGKGGTKNTKYDGSVYRIYRTTCAHTKHTHGACHLLSVGRLSETHADALRHTQTHSDTLRHTHFLNRAEGDSFGLQSDRPLELPRVLQLHRGVPPPRLPAPLSALPKGDQFRADRYS